MARAPILKQVHGPSGPEVVEMSAAEVAERDSRAAAIAAREARPPAEKAAERMEGRERDPVLAALLATLEVRDPGFRAAFMTELAGRE